MSVYRRSSFKEGFVWGNPSIKVDFKAWNRSRRWDSCQIFFLNLQKQKRFSVIKNPGFICSTSRGVFCTPVFQILCMPKNDCLTLHCRAFLFLLLSSLTSLQFRLSTIFKISLYKVWFVILTHFPKSLSPWGIFFTNSKLWRKDVSPQVTFLPATFLPATFLPKNHFSPLLSKICTGATFLPKRRFSPRHFSPLSNFHAVTSKIRNTLS